jgi:uncharacterized protein YbjT (DUF2867 family)
MGQRLAAVLNARGHNVLALCRQGSEQKVPSGCGIVIGDPLHSASFVDQISRVETWVHLVGVPHPNPRKAEEFNAVDLKSVEQAVPAAKKAGIKHLVYVSVAHPAPMMHAYIEVRGRCEQIICDSGLNATILRPWYVLGPGHRWPYLLKPVYALLEKVPSTAESARRLGLVTLQQMIAALVYAVETPAIGIQVMEVPHIREQCLSTEGFASSVKSSSS